MRRVTCASPRGLWRYPVVMAVVNHMIRVRLDSPAARPPRNRPVLFCLRCTSTHAIVTTDALLFLSFLSFFLTVFSTIPPQFALASPSCKVDDHKWRHTPRGSPDWCYNVWCRGRVKCCDVTQGPLTTAGIYTLGWRTAAGMTILQPDTWWQDESKQMRAVSRSQQT